MQEFFLPLTDGVLIPFLRVSYSVIPNYGIGIIALTLLIKAIFFPLTKKGIVAMQHTQKLQPKLEELKKKFKSEPQKLQLEIMALYKKEKASPFGACLPQLIQIPIFIGMFFSLTSESFKSLVSQEDVYAGFLPLWIENLGQPDPYYVLPILLGAVTFLSQKVSPSMATGSAAQIQKQMMYFMPFLMVFFCLKMPTGVQLFWLTNTIATTLQQYSTLKTKT